MLAKFGGFLYRRRIAVLCVTMAVVIGAIIFSQSLFRVLNTGAIRTENSDSSQALQVKIGGTIPVSIATVEQSGNDLRRAETITFPLLLLLLLVVFGGLVAAGLPLFIGVLVVLVSFAVLYGFSTVTDISVYV